jgi:hypothetical protein
MAKGTIVTEEHKAGVLRAFDKGQSINFIARLRRSSATRVKEVLLESGVTQEEIEKRYDQTTEGQREVLRKIFRKV